MIPAWLVEYLLLSAVWGTSFLFMQLSVHQFGVVPTAALRVAIATVILLPWLILRQEWPALRRDWRRIALAGIINPTLPFMFYAYALQSLATGLASILNATTPLFGALIAMLWLKERLSPSRVLGLSIGFVGVVALAWSSLGAGRPDLAGQGLAVLVCLGAPLLYGLGACYTQRYLRHVSSLATAGGTLLTSTVVLALPAAWLWPAQSPDLHAWLAVICVGVLCTGLAYVLFFRLIEKIGSARTLTVTFLIPVFAVLTGTIWLNESLTGHMLVWGLIVVLGTMLSTGIVRWKSLDTRAGKGR